ncbi:MAG: MotA/TolQ/ExbB proton channel family protein [bacterium]
MSIRLLLILHLVLVALVAINAVYVFVWPQWLENALLIAIAAALTAMAVAVSRADSRRRTALAWLQAIGTLALAAAAGALAAPAWQALGANAGGVSGARRMAPMFLIALALYGANLWLDAARAAEEPSELARLARLLSGPRLLPALIAALLLTAGTLLGMDWLARGAEGAQVVTHRFLERGIIPPITVLLFFWGLLLLLGKQWNAWHLRRALAKWRIGGDPSAPMVASLNALTFAASALEESIALLWQRHEESYVFPRYIGWAVPVLGFIGTVLGISLAADGIRRIIGSDSGLSGLSSDLSGAIAPLGIAFDTTLIALSLSVALMLLLSLAQRAEERMLATLEWEVRGASRG